MKPKQILVLAVLLVLLVVTLIVKKLQKPAELTAQEYVPLEFPLDASKVEKIQVGKGKTLFTVVKKEGGWQVSDFFSARADQEKIDRLLKEIRGAKGELRAENKSFYPDFKIGDEEAFRIVLHGKEATQNLLSLSIGNKLGGNNKIFVRQEGSEKVYLTEADLLGGMGIYGEPEKEKPTADYWASLKFAKIPTEKIIQFEITRFEKGKELLATSLSRAPDPADPSRRIWKYMRSGVPFSPDANKIQQFFEGMAYWNANKALDPKEKDYGFNAPERKMKFGLDGGGEVLITVGRKNEANNAYYVQLSGEPVVFEIPGHYLQNFNIDDSRFFADNPLEVDPEKTVKLVIHTPEKELKFNPQEKKTDALTSYLNELKTFAAVRLLFASSEQRKLQKGDRYGLEIQKENEPPEILDVGEAIPAQEKQYAAQLRNETQPFAISDSIFKKLFDNLDRLSQ